MNYNAKISQLPSLGGTGGIESNFWPEKIKAQGLAPKAVHAENKLKERVLPITILILSRLCAKG